ncbi:hypothetical protein CHELA1G11_11258 [Hyphomicrobiales bacterium]|nr:hypothetical protein CHELA1G11_11258 [Hyphomicrobiales bacterium]CAH1669026.1 hypothetical protein CHELA1G2_13051 [Hyphomicrobiales bacterium]
MLPPIACLKNLQAETYLKRDGRILAAIGGGNIYARFPASSPTMDGSIPPEPSMVGA